MLVIKDVCMRTGLISLLVFSFYAQPISFDSPYSSYRKPCIVVDDKTSHTYGGQNYEYYVWYKNQCNAKMAVKTCLNGGACSQVAVRPGGKQKTIIGVGTKSNFRFDYKWGHQKY